MLKNDIKYLRSQTVTLEKNSVVGSHRKYLPYVFTEQGVVMLATVLRTQLAAEISINILRTFIKMRKYISNELISQTYYNNMVVKHESEIQALQESFNKFEEKRKINEIYFNGQIYDAYSKIIDILREAKKDVVIIDAYADKTALDIISKLDVDLTIICKYNCLLSKMDLKKYNEQYNNLKVIYDNTFHDRYFLLDNSILYHCGTSINRIGCKTFSINKVEDSDVINLILSKINNKSN